EENRAQQLVSLGFRFDSLERAGRSLAALGVERLVAREPRELRADVRAHVAGDGFYRGDARLGVLRVEPKHGDRRLDRLLDLVVVLAARALREDVDHLGVAGSADPLDRRETPALVVVLEPELRDQHAQARAKLIVQADARDVAAPDAAEIFAGRGIADRVAFAGRFRDDDAAVRARRVEPALEQIAEHGERVRMTRLGEPARREQPVLVALRGTESLERLGEL